MADILSNQESPSMKKQKCSVDVAKDVQQQVVLPPMKEFLPLPPTMNYPIYNYNPYPVPPPYHYAGYPYYFDQQAAMPPLTMPYEQHGYFGTQSTPAIAPPKRDEPLPKDLSLTLSNQPACFQIANYNVHPTPSIVLSVPLPTQKEVHAVLVDSSSNVELDEGFQTGAARTIRAGANTLQFSGLKLNNMRTIKNEMRNKKLMKMEKFFIRIKLDNQTIETQSFKMVSSCTQLPKDIREAVRPAKKRGSISEGCAAGSGSPNREFADAVCVTDGEEVSSPVPATSSPPSSPNRADANLEGTPTRRNSAASINFLLS